MYGFFSEMPVQDVNKISMLGLAHVGDAVYELLYRSKLCTDGHTAVAEMHRMTVAFVRAEAQAEAAAKLLEEEMEQVVSLSVPLTAEAHWGRNWLEAKG